MLIEYSLQNLKSIFHIKFLLKIANIYKNSPLIELYIQYLILYNNKIKKNNIISKILLFYI